MRRLGPVLVVAGVSWRLSVTQPWNTDCSLSHGVSCSDHVHMHMYGSHTHVWLFQNKSYAEGAAENGQRREGIEGRGKGRKGKKSKSPRGVYESGGG